MLFPPPEGGYSCEQADLPCSASPLTATPSGESAASRWKARSRHIPCCPPPKSVTATPGVSGKQGWGSSRAGFSCQTPPRAKGSQGKVAKNSSVLHPAPEDRDLTPIPFIRGINASSAPLNHYKQGAEWVWRALLHSQANPRAPKYTQPPG